LKVLSDLLAAVDRGDIGVLVLLDLSAAFDTVDHTIMLERLERTFRVYGAALDWLSSYLMDRELLVRLGADSSDAATLPSGVPQGSVLGPLLFILYAADIDIILSNRLVPHIYADDIQLYGSCRPGDVSTLAARVTSCVKHVAEWMRSNRLQHNAGKTEVLWVASTRWQHRLLTEPIDIDRQLVLPARAART
jgi:hypothetical protein